jgi:transposase
MVELLNSGKEYKEIGKILGVSSATICNYVKKFNIKKIYV